MSDILPPSIRDKRTEILDDIHKSRMDALPLEKLTVRDYDKVDAKALPALIKEKQIEDFITGTMSEKMIRRLLKEADNLRRLTGTPAAVKRALEAVGIVGVLTEWWQMNPKGEKSTFKIEALVNENLVPISQPVFSPERVAEAFRLIDAAKRLSQHYTINAGSLHKAGLSFGVSFYTRNRLTVRGHLTHTTGV